MMTRPVRPPFYDELPVRGDAPVGASWGVFGPQDDIGSLHFIDDESVIAAASLIRRGQLFSLNWGLDRPDPGLFNRRTMRHRHFWQVVVQGEVPRSRDDCIDDFWPQLSSHWDALRHWCSIGGRFYDGVQASPPVQQSDVEDGPSPAATDEPILVGAVSEEPSRRLGIEHWARRGIAGRAVLVDVGRYLRRAGASVDMFDFYPITVDILESSLREQKVNLRPGDIILMRTGWTEAYDALSPEQRSRLGSFPGSPGLYGEDIARFLWDHRIAAVAADNPSVEADRTGDVYTDVDLHELLITRLGMALGELWDLATLAADCNRDGRYEAFLTSAPWNLPGAAGSPANALAIK